MSNTLPVYFRPVSTSITEAQYNESGILYNITTTVRFFTDEAMTKLAYEKVLSFEGVPYEPEWDGLLGSLYELITKNI